VGVAFSASSPDGVAALGPEGSGVALGRGPVPGFAAGGFADASTGLRAAVSSCGVHVVVSVKVAGSGAVGKGVRRPAVPLGRCARAARTVVVADGAATTVTCPVDVVTRLGVTAGDTATPPVAVASAMAVGGPFCGPQPSVLVSPLTIVGEAVKETSPCGALLGRTNGTQVAAATRSGGADATLGEAPTCGAPRMA
jgi:hypothetical protein